MRQLICAGAVAAIVTASGVVAGQKPSHQAPVGTVTGLVERAQIRLTVNPTDVLNRILSFDANADNRISRDELPERMESLVSRGDRNQDGVLTLDEIRPLIDKQPPAPRRPIRSIVRNAASLADIIADLKLPPATHNRALAIVNGPRTGDPANVDFEKEMKDLLDAEDYENYVAAAARLRSTSRVGMRLTGCVVRDPARPRC